MDHFIPFDHLIPEFGKDVFKTLCLIAHNFSLEFSSCGILSKELLLLFSVISKQCLKHITVLLLARCIPLLSLGSKETQLEITQYRTPSFLCLQLVQRINSIYCTKRGKKRLKKLSLSNVETTSLRGKGSFYSLYPLAR